MHRDKIALHRTAEWQEGGKAGLGRPCGSADLLWAPGMCEACAADHSLMVLHGVLGC